MTKKLCPLCKIVNLKQSFFFRKFGLCECRLNIYKEAFSREFPRYKPSLDGSLFREYSRNRYCKFLLANNNIQKLFKSKRIRLSA